MWRKGGGAVFWMIVNAAELIDGAGLWKQTLPEERAPRCVYLSRETACRDLVRLKGRVPEGEFFLLETVAEVVPLGVHRGVYGVKALRTAREGEATG